MCRGLTAILVPMCELPLQLFVPIPMLVASEV
jgi:hypothetical protein